MAASAVRIQIEEGLKVAACTGHLQVLALILIPDVSVSLPSRAHCGPRCSRVVALGALDGPQIGMTGLVAVTALASGCPELGVLVTEEAGCLTMLARQGNGMLGPGDLLPYHGRGVAVAAGDRHGVVVRPEVAGVTVGHLDLELTFSVAVQADHHGAELLT
jgi:hypothetical protein